MKSSNLIYTLSYRIFLFLNYVMKLYDLFTLMKFKNNNNARILFLVHIF